MSSILLLIVCLVLGWVVANVAKPPPNLAQGLNWWVLNVAFAALVLQLIPKLTFDWHLWFIPAAMFLVFLGSWAFFAVLGARLNWSRARIAALTLVGGLGNTGYIGFPLIETLRGEEALKMALVADQTGTFIAMSVGGTLVAALYSGAQVRASALIKKVLSFPPFICLFVGMLVGALGGWPATVEPILARIGGTLIPIALFSVGLQFRLRVEAGQALPIALGLTWKLLLAPVLVYGVGRAIGVSDMPFTVAVLEAAMAPMISASVLAGQNDLEPSLANAVLGTGILIAFLTIPVINHLL